MTSYNSFILIFLKIIYFTTEVKPGVRLNLKLHWKFTRCRCLISGMHEQRTLHNLLSNTFSWWVSIILLKALLIFLIFPDKCIPHLEQTWTLQLFMLLFSSVIGWIYAHLMEISTRSNLMLLSKPTSEIRKIRSRVGVGRLYIG